MTKPPALRDPDETYWVQACRNCFHPGGLHIIGDGCRFCQCPGWEPGEDRRWSDRETWNHAGTRDWHEQPVLPRDQRAAWEGTRP